MLKYIAVMVAAIAVTATVASAGGDQGRRLAGPFCVGKQNSGATAGVVRSVAATNECRSNEVKKVGVAVSGPAGPQGPKGDPGPAGATGGSGGSGPAGATGKAGESVTMKYVEADRDKEGPCEGASVYDGHTGVALTVGDSTLFVCNGRPGHKGDRGDDGEQGKPGKDGHDGQDGKDGKDGHDGKDGENGQAPS
jgi:hypothetical protein